VPSIKYVTLEGVTVCDRGRSREPVIDSNCKYFYHTYETWNLKWCLTICCNRCILTEGEWTKTTSDKIFQTKTSANNWERICTWGFVRFFVPGLLKIRGCPRCVTYFVGCRDVWQSVTEGEAMVLGKKKCRPTLFTSYASLTTNQPSHIYVHELFHNSCTAVSIVLGQFTRVQSQAHTSCKRHSPCHS